jgi:hypothetical protein
MNPAIRIAAAAIVIAALAFGGVYLALKPTAQVGPPPPTIEGTWDVDYTRQEMLAAGIADQGEDNPGNYGHFRLTFQAGWWRMDQLSYRQFRGGTATYTVDAGAAHLYSPNDDTTFDMPYTVTATTLTFGRGGPVGFRVKPWTRVATEVITATPATTNITEYRQARNAVCTDLLRQSLLPEADPVANPTGAIAAIQSVIARGDEEVDRLSALTPPPDAEADHLANIQNLRDVLTLLRQEIDLINQGKADQVAAVDQQTGPLSAQFEQFEQNYGLAGCP